jgi:hypothetical protein
MDIETPLLASSVRPKQNKLNKGASNMTKSPVVWFCSDFQKKIYSFSGSHDKVVKGVTIEGNLGDVWFFVLMLHLNLIFSYIFCVFSYIHNLNCYQTLNYLIHVYPFFYCMCNLNY